MNRIIAFLLTLSLALSACKPVITQISGEGLGTYYSLKTTDNNNITLTEIDSIIAELNNTASIFNSNSLISRINRNETDTLNKMLKHLLEVSLQVCEETNGAFDFTIGALVNLWGFGADDTKEITPDDVAKALKTVGYQKIKIEGNRIIKENLDTQLNFNAIAKGYCVDLVAEYIKSRGINNFIMDIGGELCVSGKRTPKKKWCVGIQMPTETKDGVISTQETMELQNICVATSGNYRNYIEKSGKRYGHTINPFTGYPETNNVLSATVLAPTGILADAYATAFMVMGAEKSEAFVVNRTELNAYFIVK